MSGFIQRPYAVHPLILYLARTLTVFNSKNMSDLATRIRQVHTHVDGLRRERDKLSVTVSSLEEGARETKRNVEVLHARIMELERENEVLRLVKPAAAAETDRSGSKERIDELVSEIDRCLALLKN